MPKKISSRSDSKLGPYVAQAIIDLKIDVPILSIRQEDQEILICLYGGDIIRLPLPTGESFTATSHELPSTIHQL